MLGEIKLITAYLQSSDHQMRDFTKPHLNYLNYKHIIGCQCRQKTEKISKYTDNERVKIPKTDYLLTDNEDEESISMGFQVCRPQNCRVQYHLKRF